MKIYLNKPLKKGTYIGLDLATRSGYAVLRSDSKKIEVVEYGLVCPKSSIKDHIAKLVDIEEKIKRIIDKYKKEKLIITMEDCYYKGNAQTIKVLARIEGFILHSLLLNYGSPENKIYIIYPSTAKRLAGGKGNFSKRETVSYVNKLLKKKIFVEKDHDRTDAIILAIAGANK